MRSTTSDQTSHTEKAPFLKFNFIERFCSQYPKLLVAHLLPTAETNSSGLPVESLILSNKNIVRHLYIKDYRFEKSQ